MLFGVNGLTRTEQLWIYSWLVWFESLYWCIWEEQRRHDSWFKFLIAWNAEDRKSLVGYGQVFEDKFEAALKSSVKARDCLQCIVTSCQGWLWAMSSCEGAEPIFFDLFWRIQLKPSVYRNCWIVIINGWQGDVDSVVFLINWMSCFQHFVLLICKV